MEPKKITLDSKNGFGIVLSGGGAGGAYQAGVIKALKEAGINFKLAAGSSVGALNASLIAADKIDRMINIWENINQRDVINFWPTSFRRGFIFNNSPLENLIKREIDKDASKKIIDSSIKLIIISLNLKNQKEIVNQNFKDSDQVIKSLMASCSIPVAFPLQEFPVEGDGNPTAPLVDGGIVNNFPIRESIESGLCKNFFTISLNVFGIEPPDDKKKKGLINIGMKTLRTVLANSYAKEIDGVREKIDLADNLKEIFNLSPSNQPSVPQTDATAPILPPVAPSEKDNKIKKLYEQYKAYEDINIIEINPTKPLPMGILEFSSDKAKKAIDMGYADAKEKLKELEII